MPRCLKIEHKKFLVIVEYSGVITDDDLTSCMRELEEAKFPPHYNELADLRAVTRFDASPTMLRLVANRSQFFGPDSVRVILAPSTEAFGIGRMVQIYAELSSATPFLVVHTEAEAEVILGVKLGK